MYKAVKLCSLVLVATTVSSQTATDEIAIPEKVDPNVVEKESVVEIDSESLFGGETAEVEKEILNGSSDFV